MQTITPELTAKLGEEKLAKFNIGDDCPIFDGMYDYLGMYAGASLDALRKLISGMSDIAINWSGGLHHAKSLSQVAFATLTILCLLSLTYYVSILV